MNIKFTFFENFFYVQNISRSGLNLLKCSVNFHENLYLLLCRFSLEFILLWVKDNKVYT